MNERHYYELLQDQPCHLYFDLEYEIAWNPEKDSTLMLEEFKRYVLGKLASEFNLHDVETVQMDSTSSTKFSKHLIMRSQEYKFQNNIVCGHFVKSIVSELEMAYAVPSHELHALASLLHVASKDGSPILFLDHGVYTKNRNFRLWLSSKMGKNIILKLEPPQPFTFQTFLKTLVCDGVPSKVLQLVSEDSNQSHPILRNRMRISSVNQTASLYPSIESRLLYWVSEYGNPPFIRSFIHYSSSMI
jgi:hypothetical protein